MKNNIKTRYCGIYTAENLWVSLEKIQQNIVSYYTQNIQKLCYHHQAGSHTQ